MAYREEEQSLDLIPRDHPLFIRIETALSRFPIHRLTKKDIEINLEHLSEKGKLELLWQVSYNEREGPPGLLAYKLDTTYINRILDEERNRLGRYVRLGSLREICREMDMADSGKNRNDIKKALLQNASTFIKCNLKYKDKAGSERTFNANFTRYSVIFTGEEFSDGRKADAVYLSLNEPYREILEHAQIRPLDFEYLKALTPTTQRFYEIISYNVFAALRAKKGSPANYIYSELCELLPQERFHEREKVRKQMWKLHKPHLDSGYLESADIERRGEDDFLLIYWPGPKAKKEYGASMWRKEELNP
ncbi:MAG TPA: hypothetical protein VFD58_08315 [Blastocatellia bacterium]|nr:hypothetical protein [Blastocatellia bacterium]